MWIARNKSGDLYLWLLKPVRYGTYYYSSDWSSDNIWESQEKDTDDNYCFPLDESLFPNLKWEDEPIEVGLYMIEHQIPVSKQMYSKAIRSQLKIK